MVRVENHRRLRFMTISEWLLTWAATSATAVVVLGGLAYMLRDLILARLAARIKHEYDEELARLRSKLAQGEFRYSIVFKETADTIVKTYQKLLEVYEAAQNVTNDWSDEERRKELGEALRLKASEFAVFFPPIEIYIPKKTRRKVTDFWHTLHTMVRRHGMLRQLSSGPSKNPATEEKMAKNVEGLQNQAAKLMVALQDDFQLILGFPMDDDDKSESK